MRRYLGIAVSRGLIRAVALKRSRVAWAAECPIEGPDELAPALAELVANRPRGVTRARVVLEGELLQVKTIEGIPRLSAAQLERAVALQAGRWFLRNGKPLVTGAARLKGSRVLAIAVEREVLDRIADGVAGAGLALEGIGAATAACASLLPDGEHVFQADRVSDRVMVLGHEVQSLRRARTPTERSAFGVTPTADPFRLAHAAALGPGSPRLDSARVSAERQAGRRRLALRIAGAAMLLWLAAGAVFAARATTVIRRFRAERVALRPALDAALAVERDLDLADDLLRTVQTARRDRSRDALLLSVLRAAVPDSAHLMLLRRDANGRVTLTGYANSAARVLASLAGAGGVVSPVLQGGITSETTAGRRRERFAITFEWRPADGKP